MRYPIYPSIIQSNGEIFPKSSYEDELRTAAEIGGSAYEKLRYPLPSIDASVFFDDAFQARIISNSFSWSSLFSPFRSTTQARQSPYPSAQVVYRGHDEAVRRSLPPPRRPGTPGTAGATSASASASASTPSSPASKPNAVLGPAPAPAPGPVTATPTPRPGPGQEHKLRPQSLDGKLVDLKKRMQKKAADGTHNHNNGDATAPLAEREEATAAERRLLAEAEEGGGEQPGPSGGKVGEGPSQDVTDLIFIIHGIGQGVSRILLYTKPSRLIPFPPADRAVRILQLCLCDEYVPSSSEVSAVHFCFLLGLYPSPLGSKPCLRRWLQSCDRITSSFCRCSGGRR